MTIGDRIILHISPGHSDALGLPRQVGVIRAIDTMGDRAALLVHFNDLSVYVSGLADEEIEIVQTAREAQ